LTPLYSLAGVGMRYGGVSVLENIHLEFRAGEFVALAGPNGAGKSTLLSIMAALRPGHAGSCKLLGREVQSWHRRAFARQVSVVPQSIHIDFGFTAEQIVLMGRTPFADTLFESENDVTEVRRAMELTGTMEFRDRDFRTLSGGERQRVIVAAALAQSPKVLLLDEPTAFLDIEHQISLYTLLRQLCDSGVLIVSVTHDLNLAARYSDRVLLLRGGKLLAEGRPDTVFCESTIHDVFHVHARVVSDAGRKWIHYGS
jgi:ABC-type cobalamin/Fe3+-siderophores transport system ATPase subunit